MKKNKFLITFLVVFMSLLLTGCGNEKKLVCKNSSPNVDITFDMKYDSNKLKKFKISYSINLSSYSTKQSEEYIQQDFCSTIENTMDFKGALKGCNQKNSGEKILVNTEVDITKVNEDKLKQYDNIDNVKNDFENAGFTCNISE